MKKPKEKKLIFSLNSQDFEWQFFMAGGKGGQNVDKRHTACRCIHAPSGAVAEAREHRHQSQNKSAAFRRCVESPKFQKWARIHASLLAGNKSPDEIVDEMMENISDFKLEVKDSTGKWVEITLEDFLATS